MSNLSNGGPRGIAVVTGASAGIGKAYADRLAARGYDLLLIARRGDRLEGVGDEIRAKHGVAVTTRIADLGSPTGLEAVAREIEGDERITLLVNNAGTSSLGLVADTTTDLIDAMNMVNLTALVRLTAAVLPKFKSRNQGTIINIGSVLGFKALPISTVYSSTKAYVTFFTRGLQEEFAGTDIRIQLVAPAATATDIWEISGVPLSALDPATVMTVGAMVDAAFVGLDAGELVTMPSVENADDLVAAFDAASLAILGSSQNGAPARRYAAPEAQAA